MKKIAITTILIVTLGLSQVCPAETGDREPLAGGRIFHDPQDLFGIAPTDSSVFPLLSRGRPMSGFAFVLFYSEADLRRLDVSSIEKGEIVLRTPERGRGTVFLSEIAGFELDKYRKLSRGDLAGKRDEIVSRLVGLHGEYRKEYEKYLSNMFKVSEDTYYIDAWNYLYDRGKQELNLPLLQGPLSEGLRSVSYRDCNKWDTLWIKLKLPANMAEEVAKGAPRGAIHLDRVESPRALYTYTINPKPGVMKREDNKGRVDYWMPSLDLYRIEISLRDKTNQHRVGYMLEEITPSTVKCGPSFGRTYVIHPTDRSPL